MKTAEYDAFIKSDPSARPLWNADPELLSFVIYALVAKLGGRVVLEEKELTINSSLGATITGYEDAGDLKITLQMIED